MSDVSLRSATRNDIGAILELWLEAEAPPTVTDNEDALARLLERDGEALIVALLGDRIVGTLIVGWDGWRGNMYRLAVHPGHRRAGIARLLVEEGEHRLRAQGALRITALVLRDEPHAVSTWAAVGYEEQTAMARFRKHLD